LSNQCKIQISFRLYDIETQYYALALINVIMSKSNQNIRQSLVVAMSNQSVITRLRELVQSIVSNVNHQYLL